jgi:hypothetical protein
MSEVLYYSNFCPHSKDLLLKISRSKKRDDMHFICIDKREKHVDGSTSIIMDNGKRLLLPPNVVNVPSILLLHHGNRVIGGLSEIYNYFRPGETKINDTATKGGGEPMAFSSFEMGSTLSDNYSYLDMTPDELSAKGDGGLRMKHSFIGINESQSIQTPPEDYIPNKVGEVDLGKLEQQRNLDVDTGDKAPLVT